MGIYFSILQMHACIFMLGWFLQVVEYLIFAGANVSAVNRYDSRLH